MAHGVDHAPELPRVLALDAVADPAQAEGAQRVDLPAVRAVARPRLDDAHLAHDAVSVGAGGSAADSPALPSPPSSVSPSTCATVRPRSSATCSGVRSDWRPATVAFTRLIGFCEPRLLERMSWIPPSSSTARTPPPAITPVPGEAGLSSTCAPACRATTSCGMVAPDRLTRLRLVRALSVALRMASGTTRLLPTPMPTRPLLSPTTTTQR